VHGRLEALDCPEKTLYWAMDPEVAQLKWTKMTDMSQGMSPVGQGNCASICSWRTRVLAAEAKKAGAESEITHHIPRPPCLIGIEACNH